MAHGSWLMALVTKIFVNIVLFIFSFTFLNSLFFKMNENFTGKRRKGKAFPIHDMKAYKGGKGIVSLILNLHTRSR
jgi:hypothetical protein